MKIVAALVVAAPILGISFVLTVGEVIAILDPRGTKLSDDADPFGPTIPVWQHCINIAIIFVLYWLAYKIIISILKEQKGKSLTSTDGDLFYNVKIKPIGGDDRKARLSAAEKAALQIARQSFYPATTSAPPNKLRRL